MLSRTSIMVTSLETLKIPFALNTKLFEESVSRDIGTEGYVEAEPLYQRALAINEWTLGPDHPDVATVLNNLALLYSCQGKYAEAELLHRRAIEIRGKVLGAEHPEVANSLENLAGVYFNQGKYAEAEPLLKRALTMVEKGLGADHPDMVLSLENYATLLRKMNRDDEAARLETRAEEIRAKANLADPNGRRRACKAMKPASTTVQMRRLQQKK